MVFGAGGQVGLHLIETASGSGHHMVALTHSDADICDSDAVAAGNRQARADRSSSMPRPIPRSTRPRARRMRAFQVNRDGAAILAEQAAKADLPLIHISTDYVFDGSATRSLRRGARGQSARRLCAEQGSRRARRPRRPRQAPDPAHCLGLWPVRRQFRQDHAQARRRARGASRRRRPDRAPDLDRRSCRGDPRHRGSRAKIRASPIGAPITMPAPTPSPGTASPP